MDVAVRSESTVRAFAEVGVVFDLFQLINKTPLIDRLYRRYVRREDNFQTLKDLENILKNTDNKLLVDLIENFREAIEDSEYFFKKYGEYFPIRFCIHDVFFSMVEEHIPLEDYDNLEGDPLWMRAEYMMEKYGK